MAGLALLAITVYLLRRGKPLVYTLLPMAFMLVSTVSAMSMNLVEFWSGGQWVLFATGAVNLLLALWLTAESALAVRLFRRRPVIEDLEVEFGTATIHGGRSQEEKT